MSDATSSEPLSRIDAERADDQRTDAKAILVIFCVAIAMAVHFISGWTF
jgi:hypothetical protein